jgi:hypothetical protein
MHVNEQFFRESSARLRKAERNVQLARQFSCMHPRAIVASAAKESFGKKLARAVKGELLCAPPRANSTKNKRNASAIATASQNDASAPTTIDASRRKNGARLR